MRIYTYSEARQNFSALLKLALNEEVFIKRRDGSQFKIVPCPDTINDRSPFDIEGVDTNLSSDDMLSAVRESRERMV